MYNITNRQKIQVLCQVQYLYKCVFIGFVKGLVAYIKLTNKIKRTIPKQIFDTYIVVVNQNTTIYSMY